MNPKRIESDLHLRIADCLAIDQRRMRAWWNDIRRLPDGPNANQRKERELDRLVTEIERSIDSVRRRREMIPLIRFPDDLPVVARKDEIATTIAANQVIVLCGETGSGKTTQLPKICLELGRGTRGLIGHTQPRRIAARSVAARISDELGQKLGEDRGIVGYKVRFGDKTSRDNLIKVMTDGILLAETQTDRLLERYDTLIIDEAHERSLNIDFLLGFLKFVLPRRPDLKVIITSATIDPERFAGHFEGTSSASSGRPTSIERPTDSNTVLGTRPQDSARTYAPARVPILSVSGRTYPVEVRYRAPQGDADADEPTLPLLRAIDECASDGPGDILVFLPGEREIREAAEAIRKHHPPQNRIFQSHPGRRIVLSTNVAETSLTVPGIRYVIDAGYARINRYSLRTRVQRLEIEAISRASADQRKGRCGRIAPGVCIRLYSEEDFKGRDEYTDPEILRTNLASVILQMKSLKLGNVEDFPFIEPPEPKMIRDGYETLRELGAVDEGYELTKIGWQLAKLPIDPRIGRMIIEADKEHCLDEVLIIAAALSTQDPRERRGDSFDAADTAHLQFKHSDSDFLSTVYLWNWYEELYEKISRSKLVKACHTNYLNFMRMREWYDVHRQLHALCAEMKLRVGRTRHAHGRKPDVEQAPYDAIHRSLLTGMLTSIGRKTEQGDYLGTHGTRFSIFPGSGQFKIKPKWVMASELVLTTKLYARMVAKIDPEWIERAAEHLVKRSYAEPEWSEKGQRVTALEKVWLYGLEVVPGRPVHYGPIDPNVSRELFIINGLIEGEIRTGGRFLRHNQDLIKQVLELEHKARKRDLLVDNQSRFDFFDKRLPADIYNTERFEKWREEAERGNPNILFMSRADLMLREASEVTLEQFPELMFVAGGGSRLKVEYHFEPGSPHDGVTVNVPVEALNQIDKTRAEWLVPGLLVDKIEALLRSIPKTDRRNLGQPPEVARQIAPKLKFGEGPLIEAVRRELSLLISGDYPRGILDRAAMPEHLKMHFRVVDAKGQVLAEGRDLERLQRDLGMEVQSSFAQLSGGKYDKDGLRDWDFGDLPEKMDVRRGQMVVAGFPTLLEAPPSKDPNAPITVSIRVIDSPERARQLHRAGVRRLLIIKAGREIRHMLQTRIALGRFVTQYATIGTADELKADLLGLIAERAFNPENTPIRRQADFEKRLEQGWPRIAAAVDAVGAMTQRILDEHQAARFLLDSPAPAAHKPILDDVREQLAYLFKPGFLLQTPPEWLQHLPRYLAAVRVRLSKVAAGGPSREPPGSREAQLLWKAYVQRGALHEKSGVSDPELTVYRWMVEEFRVSVFAQELRTSMPVSLKRLQEQWLKIGKP